jgi:hypothetical protein
MVAARHGVKWMNFLLTFAGVLRPLGSRGFRGVTSLVLTLAECFTPALQAGTMKTSDQHVVVEVGCLGAEVFGFAPTLELNYVGQAGLPEIGPLRRGLWS